MNNINKMKNGADIIILFLKAITISLISYSPTSVTHDAIEYKRKILGILSRYFIEQYGW
jgi:hypothetical protein